VHRKEIKTGAADYHHISQQPNTMYSICLVVGNAILLKLQYLNCIMDQRPNCNLCSRRFSNKLKLFSMFKIEMLSSFVKTFFHHFSAVLNLSFLATFG